MSNRAQRRSDTRAFRREVHRDHILTHLIDVNADLDGYPLLSRAAAYWRSGIPTRKPYCIACRSSFAETAEAGAYLFATPPGTSDIASVSALCVECWRDLPDDEVEQVATRLLRHLAPNGHFIDPR
jgi:hypothetical protein